MYADVVHDVNHFDNSWRFGKKSWLKMADSCYGDVSCHSYLLIELIDGYKYMKSNYRTVHETYCGGIRGWVDRVLDLKSLAPHCCGFESHQRLLILSFDEAIQLVYGRSVVLPMCPLISEILQGGPFYWGLPPTVLQAGTFTVLVPRKT